MRVPLAESWVVDLFCFLEFVVDLPNIRLTTGPQSTPQYWSRCVADPNPADQTVGLDSVTRLLTADACGVRRINRNQTARQQIRSGDTLRYLGAQRGIAEWLVVLH